MSKLSEFVMAHPFEREKPVLEGVLKVLAANDICSLKELVRIDT